jgi:hypothetical protein
MTQMKTARSDPRLEGSKNGDRTDTLLRDIESPPDDGYCSPRAAGLGGPAPVVPPAEKAP